MSDVTFYEAGRPVEVKKDAGYINGGLTGVLVEDYEIDETFAYVKWDEGQDNAPVDGYYVGNSLDFPEPVAPPKPTVSITEALSEAIERTYDEAYEAGRQAGIAEANNAVELANLRVAVQDVHDKVFALSNLND